MNNRSRGRKFADGLRFIVSRPRTRTAIERDIVARRNQLPFPRRRVWFGDEGRAGIAHDQSDKQTEKTSHDAPKHRRFTPAVTQTFCPRISSTAGDDLLVPLPDASRAADALLDCWIARVGHLARSGYRYL